MDCRTVADRLAPYLDGELGPSEGAQLDEHFGRCAGCRARVEAMAQQRFPALTPASRALATDLFDEMDQALATELDAELQRRGREGQPRLAFWRRRMPVRGAHVFAYAALLLLTVAWALNAHQQAGTAQARAELLERQLERERRLAGEPVLVPAEGYRMVTYTPHRGTF